ncbi:MAG: NAD(P)H-dependent oxidoreductase, partial [Peptococcaceae bacterium]|nr:NAD(P)H-dependent oxidoreductase [Peptococcaceae bacterium]
NGCILRSGKDAWNSARAITDALQAGLAAAVLDPLLVQLVEDVTRESSYDLMRGVGYIDLLIPRGGAGLIRACVDNAKVPCIETGTGICHIYIDGKADLQKAVKILVNAKTSRPSVCNAAEVCLVDGAIAETVLPAIRRSNVLLFLCPNYNDAVSANLSAFINRLTALFNQVRFYNKAVFAIVVSGYSGGDIVAKQVLGALNMNKSFLLPAKFALFATANDPFSIEKIADIDAQAAAFAHNMLAQLKK